MRGKYVFGALAGVALLAVVGCSSSAGDEAAAAGRPEVVTVTMTDNVYRPTRIEVRKGDEVVFRFVNEGKLVHEAFLGDENAQEEHAATMAGGSGHAGMPTDHGGMAMGHDPMVTVPPGRTAEMRHRFDETGAVLLGCHQPGHWEAGMKATVDVE
jgi:uncharacterized cupredoxin-like copper-binding protein